MMETRVEVFLKKGITDSSGEGIKNDIQDLGIKKVKKVETARIYLIEGKISQSQTRTICQNLLVDPLIQEYQINSKLKTTKSLRARSFAPSLRAKRSNLGIATSSPLLSCESKKRGLLAMTPKLKVKETKVWTVEVWPKKGVTDTVAESTRKGIWDMGIKGVKKVRTGKKYLLFGPLSSKEIETICQRLLANKVIQNYSVNPVRRGKEK